MSSPSWLVSPPTSHGSTDVHAYFDNDDILPGPRPLSGAIAKAQWLDAVARDATLPVATGGVALVVASYLNRQRGVAWPSTAELGNRCDMSPRQVIRHLDTLENAGYLNVERGPNRGQGQRRAAYRLELPVRRSLHSLP